MANEILTAVIAASGGVIIALIGLYSAKKLKIGQAQEKLVDTLQELIEAQDRKIKDLTASLDEAHTKILTLQQEVEALKNLTIEQALEIKGLESIFSETPVTRRRRVKLSEE